MLMCNNLKSVGKTEGYDFCNRAPILYWEHFLFTLCQFANDAIDVNIVK